MFVLYYQIKKITKTDYSGLLLIRIAGGFRVHITHTHTECCDDEVKYLRVRVLCLQENVIAISVNIYNSQECRPQSLDWCHSI